MKLLANNNSHFGNLFFRSNCIFLIFSIDWIHTSHPPPRPRPPHTHTQFLQLNSQHGIQFSKGISQCTIESQCNGKRAPNIKIITQINEQLNSMPLKMQVQNIMLQLNLMKKIGSSEQMKLIVIPFGAEMKSIMFLKRNTFEFWISPPRVCSL